MRGYFDANATTPMVPEAREEWLRVSSHHWHNPSGLYPEAVAAREFLEGLREELGGWLGCSPRRIVFTSGATEANHAVMAHAALGKEKVVISAVEHPSVTAGAARFIDRQRLREVGVTPGGVLDLVRLEEVLDREKVGWVSLMAANNESGVVQPWREVADRCRERGVRFHCDASQWIGKRSAEGFAVCDFVTASAHKFGGPTGTGFLVVPEGTSFCAQAGGPQERGLRGGTESLPAIAAMVAALKAAPAGDGGNGRNHFEKDLVECLPGVRLLGAEEARLDNTSMIVLPRHKNLRWLTRLGKRGFAVSTGSACSAGQGDPSRVMQAMGCSFEEMGRVLRISALPGATAEDWESLLDALLEVRDELDRRGAGNPSGIRKISLENL